MLTLTSNPWNEDEAPQVWHAIAVLVASQSRCAELSAKFPPQKKSITEFRSDLEFLESAYRKDVRSYRATRVLTAVHLPALFECLDELAENAEGSGPEIDRTLELAFKIASESRDTVCRATLDSAKVALDTIESSVKPSSPETPKKTSWLGSVADGAQVAARNTLSPLSTALGTGYNKVSQDAGRRISGLTSYAATATGGLVEEAISLVVSPVNTHLGALKSAVWTAAGATALESVLIAVLFPPALPLAVGAGILEGTASYSDHLAKERKKEEGRRSELRSARDEKSKRALSKVFGKSSIVSLSSPHVYVTMDTDKDVATGTVLSGKFIGQRLDDISHADLTLLTKHAPDKDTQTILQSWQRREASRA